MAKERITSYEEVLSVSADLFLENGYDKTTIRMITDMLNIHIGSLYYLYPNKEEILKTMIYAFYGDILCNSSRITRESGKDIMMMLLPPAFLLYSASRSKRLARLLYQSLSSRSLMVEVLDQTYRWFSRFDIGSNDTQGFFVDYQFLFGGLGNMIGEISEDENYIDIRCFLAKYSDAAFGILGVQRPDDIRQMIDEACNIAEKEDIRFLDRDLGYIDSD